ncbi:MAG: hypothetical protein AB1664_00705 [Thermodesulfobacteriota bacterium]
MMFDNLKESVNRLFRRKDVTPYEKRDEAFEQLMLAQGLSDMMSMPAWPRIREWLLTEVQRMQDKQNELSADPMANAAEIVHLNAARQARQAFLTEIEDSAKRATEWRRRINELDEIIDAAEALKRAQAAG